MTQILLALQTPKLLMADGPGCMRLHSMAMRRLRGCCFGTEPIRTRAKPEITLTRYIGRPPTDTSKSCVHCLTLVETRTALVMCTSSMPSDGQHSSIHQAARQATSLRWRHCFATVARGTTFFLQCLWAI